MAQDYVTRFKADMTRHDAAIKSSTQLMQSFDKTVKKAEGQVGNFNRKLNGIAGDIKKLGLSKLQGQLGDIGNIIANNLVGSLGKVTVSGGSASSILGKLGSVASLSTPALLGIGAAIATLAANFAALAKSAKYEVNLDKLQSMTGLDDSGMRNMSKAAIDMSKNFRSSAGEIVDSMRLIGSQFPSLLKNTGALVKVTEAANVLSEAAGISVVDAASGITTVLNQMKLPASEATNIINALAAGSQQGAADIAYLNQAMGKSGTQFADAKVSYVEAIAAIESIAPKFSSADVAGSQLNSTLLKLSTQANSNFKPSVVGLGKALENLANAQLSDLQLKQLVGESNVTMIKSLIQARDKYEELTVSLEGTDTAFKQMEINMDNLPSKIQLLKNAWGAMLLDVGENSPLVQGMRDGLGKTLDHLSTVTMPELGVIINGLSNTLWNLLGAVGNLVAGILPFNDDMEALRVTMKAIGEVFKWLIRLIENISITIKWLCDIIAKGLTSAWNKLGEIISKTDWFKGMKDKLDKVLEWWDKTILSLTEKWKKFKKWLRERGLTWKTADDYIVAESSDGSVDWGDDTVNYTPVPINPDNTTPTIGTNKEREILKGTIEWYQKEIQKINDELQQTIPTETRLNELLDTKADYLEELTRLQEEYGLATKKAQKEEKKEVEILPAKGSYRDIQNQLSQLNEQLDFEVYGTEKYWSLVKSIKELTSKELEISLKLDEDLMSDADKKLRDLQRNLEITNRVGDDASSVFSSLGTAMTNFGNATEDSQNKTAQIIGIVSQGISELIPQIIALMTAEQAEALAAGTSQAAKLPYPANIAAIFSMFATLSSVYAGIKGLKSYANGGIIKGNTSIGDYNLARVNGGEMILNGSQQDRLFRVINEGNMSNSTVMAGNVDFQIRGDVLVGALRNYEKKKGRIG